jgi:hypothetical protein
MTTRFITVLFLTFGVAQASTALPVIPGKAASSTSSQLLQYTPSRTATDSGMDDDEAAPPIHIHHASATRKKPIHKPVTKKVLQPPPVTPPKYSLLIRPALNNDDLIYKNSY